MKYLLILALVALACCNVVTVTSENWDEVAATPAFVKFYAPWCGHCKHLAPIWEELADEVAGEEVVIGEIDCTENEELCRKFEVRGYPTLIYIEGEAQVTYNGPRELTDLATWVVAMMGPAVHTVDTIEAESSIYFVNTGSSDLFDEVANTHKVYNI
ncbi:hypothetical protein KIPB_003897 [Kipferlia bialata]|uniref:Thioredoxin domain-containing protein n=1 Tax=Kipferlia bialata TaxID=797122 RepID=A0A391NKA6_9EUKA|nr:hypothetical protein KIPB_003897 [Kipferlia bialata]|eukprot:g3897.t1